MSGSPPFSSFYDVANLPEKGADLAISPGTDERAQIAAWLEIQSLGGLKASIKLTRSPSGFRYRAQFEADVVQASVVSLEAVPAHLSGDFERSYQLAPSPSRAARKRNEPPVVALNPEDEDAPELVDSTMFDLAAPILEELSLALDPYPRKAGEAFIPPEPAENAPNTPFAILKKLKES
ncbi:MAG TPA: DUF177 domain-containing protein [Micropepsaceae bacterium]|nr:DUF177 domain-containing protein [Micropepsaceae bacterium]